jgi:hypothetical protein
MGEECMETSRPRRRGLVRSCHDANEQPYRSSTIPHDVQRRRRERLHELLAQADVHVRYRLMSPGAGVRNGLRERAQRTDVDRRQTSAGRIGESQQSFDGARH